MLFSEPELKSKDFINGQVIHFVWKHGGLLAMIQDSDTRFSLFVGRFCKHLSQYILARALEAVDETFTK